MSNTEQQDLLKHCLSHKSAYLDYPFGEEPVCVKVGGKLFADVYLLREDNYKITLKGEPMTVDFYRKQYPGTVGKGYHCPAALQPYWYTVYLNQAVADSEIIRMIGESYRQTVKKLTGKKRAELGL